MKDKQTTETINTKTCPSYVAPNESGAGYYRFTLDSAGWSSLLSNIEAQNTREALVAMDSLVAAFRAGEVEASVFLDGMTAFAKHPEYDVASGSTRLIEFMYDELPEARDDLARYVKGNYADRFQAIRGQESVEGQLLAPTLASLLVNRGGDETLAREMAEKGAAYLGVGGSVNKKAVAGNMLRLSLAEAMKALGADTYDPLVQLVASGTPFEKSAALAALASTKDKEIADQLKALALNTDGPLTGRQSNTLVNRLLASEAHGDETWLWLKDNFTNYVTNRVPDVRKGRMPSAGGNFCSLDRRDEVKRFMEANAGVIPGYERSLAQTIETIELCAALREEKGTDIIAALAGR